MNRESSTVQVRRLSTAIAVFVLLLFLAAGFITSSATAADTTGGRAKHGEALFKERCVSCHNKQPGDTSPFGPPNLNGIFRGPSPLTTKQAVTIIENGKSPMPGFRTVLTRADIDDLIAYLKTR